MFILTSALLLTVNPVDSAPELVTPSATGSASRIPASPQRPMVGEAPTAGLASQPQDHTSSPAIIVPPPPAPTSTDPITPPGEPSPDKAPPDGQPADQAARDEIVITGVKEPAPDPLRAVNAESFAVTQTVDAAVVGPAARAYKEAVPGPVRGGIHNFLYNLREPIVFLNFLLQFKLGKAVETVGRFAINSTIGAVGLVDIARRKPFRLPRRSNGFANTLGFYGVDNGPFLFLPLVGPTTVRDLLGGAIDRLVLPVAVGSPFTSLAYTAPAGVLGALDHRSEFDQTLKDLHDNSPDPYAATRAFYLNRRQAEIDQLRGRAGGDPAGMTAPPASVRPFVPKHLETEVPPSAAPVEPIPAPPHADKPGTDITKPAP